MNSRRALWRFLAHALVIFFCIVAFFFAHELGHALGAKFFGARVAMFNVLGMQWYPKLEWLPHLGLGGYVYWFAPVNGDEFYRTNHRLIVMAGSTITLLIALISAIALNAFAIRGVLRTALFVMSFYSLDSFVKMMVALDWLPLGLNSRFLRTFSEAYFAALGLGIASHVYIGAILVSCAFIFLLLARACRPLRATPHRADSI